MKTIQEKIHALVNRVDDPVLLENIYNCLDQHVSKTKRNISDELSPGDLQSLHEAQEQYRRGETIPHEEVLRFLEEWRPKK